MLSSSGHQLPIYSVLLSGRSLEHKKKLLVFCLCTKRVFCTTAQERIALPAPPPRPPGEATVNTNLFCMEMTSQVQCFPPFWGDCQVLIYCSYLTRSHIGVRGPSWGRSRSAILSRERPLTTEWALWHRMERRVNLLSPYLQEPFSATSQFLTSLQRPHTLIHFNSYMCRH